MAGARHGAAQKRGAGRRGAVALGGVGAQPGAALGPGVRCRRGAALCGTRLAHYAGLCVGGGGGAAWAC